MWLRRALRPHLLRAERTTVLSQCRPTPRPLVASHPRHMASIMNAMRPEMSEEEKAKKREEFEKKEFSSSTRMKIVIAFLFAFPASQLVRGYFDDTYARYYYQFFKHINPRLRAKEARGSTFSVKVAFQRFDSDGNGLISAQDLRRVFAEEFDCPLTLAEVDEFLDYADVDKDHELSYGEFVDLVLTLREVRSRFRAIDENGDGYLSKAEIAGVMATLDQPLSEVELRDMMEEADTDRDGRVSFKEFAWLMMSTSDVVKTPEGVVPPQSPAQRSNGKGNGRQAATADRAVATKTRLLRPMRQQKEQQQQQQQPVDPITAALQAARLGPSPLPSDSPLWEEEEGDDARYTLTREEAESRLAWLRTRLVMVRQASELVSDAGGVDAGVDPRFGAHMKKEQQLLEESEKRVMRWLGLAIGDSK